ncbi:MAG: lactonase family protein [Verrucomicrobiota bacterium]
MNRSSDKRRIFIGTYSIRGSQGIYRAEFNAATGCLSNLQPAFALPNATYQAIHPSGRLLYSVCEEREAGQRRNGSVCALTVEPEAGRLQLLNCRLSLGEGPCHVCIPAEGRQVLVSNYAGGSVAVFPIASDGAVGKPTSFIQHHGGSGIVPNRQTGPHAHSMTLTPDNRFVFAADLGQDRILVNRFDVASGNLLSADHPEVVCTPGSGPRHMAIHPNGRYFFLIQELNNTVTVFEYEPVPGLLTARQTLSTLPENWNGTNAAAEIQVSPDGRFLYVSNRGHDSLAIFAFDGNRGALETREFVPVRGHWPRHFRLTSDGRFLLAANQESDTITVFAVDPDNGGLNFIGAPFPVPAPVCITLL